MTRSSVLALLALSTLASDCDSVPVGPSKYALNLDDMTPRLGDMCVDPAGAAVSVSASYTLTCVDEDQCGRDHGETYTVTYDIDGASENEGVVEAVELDNGDVVAMDDSCMQFTGEPQYLDPVEGWRDAGSLSPDCTVGIDGPAVAGATRFRLMLDHTEAGRMIAECDTDTAYGSPELTSVQVGGDDLCANDALVTIGGTGQATCASSATCERGDIVTFDYTLQPFGESGAWPTVTTSDGGELRLPFHCHSLVLRLVGNDNGTERTVGSVDECVLSVEPDRLVGMTDLRLEGQLSNDITVSVPCPE